jgi:hypothetical protein
MGKLAQLFKRGFIGMAVHAAALVFRRCGRGHKNNEKDTGKKDGQDDDFILHESSPGD